MTPRAFRFSRSRSSPARAPSTRLAAPTSTSDSSLSWRWLSDSSLLTTTRCSSVMLAEFSPTVTSMVLIRSPSARSASAMALLDSARDADSAVSAALNAASTVLICWASASSFVARASSSAAILAFASSRSLLNCASTSDTRLEMASSAVTLASDSLAISALSVLSASVISTRI